MVLRIGEMFAAEKAATVPKKGAAGPPQTKMLSKPIPGSGFGPQPPQAGTPTDMTSLVQNKGGAVDPNSYVGQAKALLDQLVELQQNGQDGNFDTQAQWAPSDRKTTAGLTPGSIDTFTTYQKPGDPKAISVQHKNNGYGNISTHSSPGVSGKQEFSGTHGQMAKHLKEKYSIQHDFSHDTSSLGAGPAKPSRPGASRAPQPSLSQLAQQNLRGPATAAPVAASIGRVREYGSVGLPVQVRATKKKKARQAR